MEIGLYFCVFCNTNVTTKIFFNEKPWIKDVFIDLELVDEIISIVLYLKLLLVAF